MENISGTDLTLIKPAVDLEAKLIYAVTSGNAEEVRRILKKGISVNFIDADSGTTPLVRAVFCESAEMTELLLSFGADPNMLSRDDDSPLISGAIWGGDKRVVQLLLEAGADPNLRGADPTGPGGSEKTTPLHCAVWGSARPDVVKTLIKSGADINARCNGYTPLMEAALFGFPEIINILIDAGADINAAGNKNETALHNALLEGQSDAVFLLIARGADPDIKDSSGQSPLDMAVNGRFGSVCICPNKILYALSEASRLRREDFREEAGSLATKFEFDI